jgi:hypothetical protein
LQLILGGRWGGGVVGGWEAAQLLFPVSRHRSFKNNISDIKENLSYRGSRGIADLIIDPGTR